MLKPRINDDYGGNYYQPPKKTTTPKPTAPKPAAPKATTWEQQSYWERKAEQTRLEQEKYLQQMEAELRKQWLAANKPSPVKSFFTGAGQAAQQFFQNTFMAPFTGQYYTPPATNQYAYNPAFQSQLSQSALARSLAAAKPQSFLLQDMARAGYKIPNWSAPQKQVPQTFPLGSWAQNPDQYFGSGVNMGPQKPANMEYEAYVPIGYGGYSYGGGWGGGGGSSDYTSNPFYRGEATAQKPSYYAQYLT
jgi:hypothetical protein